MPDPDNQAQAGDSNASTSTGADQPLADAAHNPADTGASEQTPESAYRAAMAAAMAPVPDGETPPLDADAGKQQEGDDEVVAEETLNADAAADDQDDQQQDDDPAEADAGPKRIRLHSDEDKAVAAIAKARKCSLVDAARIFAGETAAAPAAAEQTQQADTKPARTAADIEAEINAAWDETAKAGDEIDTAGMVAHQRKIDALNREHTKALAAEASQAQSTEQTGQAEIDRIFTADWDAACVSYPALKDPNSPLYKRMAEMDAAEGKGETDLYFDPKKNTKLAKAAAKELGVPITAPKAKAAAAPAPQTTTRPNPLASGAASTTPADNGSLEKEIASVSVADPEGYRAALAKAMGPTKAGFLK